MITPAGDPRDRHVLPNTLGISLVEIFWGLGIPVVIESTFLQLFVRHLGGSSLMIGLIPTLFSGGNALFGLLAAHLTSHLQRRRPAVILTHLATASPLLLFGVFFLLTGPIPGVLGLLLAAYALYSVGQGFLYPVWQNYLVRIFSPDRAPRALSLMYISQSAAKLASSFILAGIVQKHAFSPLGSGLVFTAVGLCFVAGSFPFLFTREPVDPAGPERRPSLPHLARTLRAALGNPNFLRFLGSDLETYALVGVISFYANYATEYCGIRPSTAAGGFVAAIYLGGVLANLLLGWMALLRLRNSLLASKVFALLAIGLLLASPSLAGFLLVSLLLGASRSIRKFTFAPAVKRLSGLSDATAYFAAAPLLLLPVSAGIPLVAGRSLDHLSSYGAAAYRWVFSGLGLLVLVSLFFLLRTRFSEEAPSGRPEQRAF